MIRAAHSTCGFTLFASFDFDLYAWAAASEEETLVTRHFCHYLLPPPIVYIYMEAMIAVYAKSIQFGD